MSETTTDRYVREFHALTLPESEWTHETHLHVGLWHLLHFSPAESMGRLRTGIRRYNVACGVENSETSGYHETITQLYVVLIADFLERRDRTLPIDVLAAELLATVGDRELPWTYYSKALLTSTRARLEWVEPDLAPLPGGSVD